MIYSMTLRSRPTETVQKSYKRLAQSFANVEGEWGTLDREWPPPKDPGKQYVGITKLRKLFPTVAAAAVQYHNRKDINNTARTDDKLSFDFDPRKANYSDLVKKVFPKYVDAFRAYRGEIANEEFIHLEFSATNKVDLLHGVYRISPVAFYARHLCAEAFRLTPEEVVQRCSGHVEEARVISDGALIIASSKILSLREADEINCKLQFLLTGKRVAPLQGLPEEESESNATDPPEPAMPKPKRKTRSSKKGSPTMLHLAKATIVSMANLELAEEDDVDPDTAVKFLESIAGELRQCTPDEISALRVALAELEKEASASGRTDSLDFYADFMQNLGFDEADE